VRLALAQLNFTVGAFDANFVKMRDAMAKARAAGADLVVFSELAPTGYPPRDLLSHSGFVEANLAVLDRVARLTDAGLGALVGFVDPNPTKAGKPLHNAVALCHNGRVADRRHKSLLPTYDVFDEDRYFEPAREIAPMAFRGVQLGVTICEDIWNDEDFWPRRLYHRDPVSELVRGGAEVLINISSSPFSLGKADLRGAMIRREAVKHQRYFFYVNQVGGNDELVFDGQSLGFDPEGHLILRAGEFCEDFLVCDVPAGARAASAGVDDRLATGGAYPADNGRLVRPASATIVEQAYRALVLGLGDYVRKCGFSRAVLGLSGGIDSALTASLAAAALGPANVLGVAMPSRYSSEHSLRDAAALARNLGIGCQVIGIDSMFDAALRTLAPAFGARPADVTEENLQARLRGAILMALSNKFGYLVLSTGNKSELAVGYCTLYGDMCGGLAVISDVPKTLVYQLARYVNNRDEVIPQSTIEKAPSAELRPNQTDQDTLPPYEVLDRIIEAYVERDLDLAGISALGIDPALAREVVSWIDRNEYKRRQAAPGLKITSKAFGVGRRYPIAADHWTRTAPRSPDEGDARR
jgi:NAD+ synthase (glutamine-hydrolysing)